jgi:hypothetical protein
MVMLKGKTSIRCSFCSLFIYFCCRDDFSDNFICYEPESLAGCRLLDHDDNPLGDQLSIPDIKLANNVDQQVEEGTEQPIITQVVVCTKGIPATPTTRRGIPKPNFFFSPRNR